MHQCPQCNYSTPFTANLHRHLAVHKKTFFGNFKCSECNYRSTRKENVIKHLTRKHNNKGVVITGPQSKEAPIPYPEVIFVANFQCNMCKFSSTNEKDVVRHKSTVHGDKGMVEANQKESSKSYPKPAPEPLPDPISEPHSNPDNQQKIVFAANFQCSACSYRSVKKEDVIKHQATKHGGDDDAKAEPETDPPSKIIFEGNYQCSMCNYRSYTKQNVTRHQFAKHGCKDDKEHCPVRKKKRNANELPASKSIKLEEEEDESEPAKRLLLAECGLIWHSDEFPKKERDTES